MVLSAPPPQHEAMSPNTSSLTSSSPGSGSTLSLRPARPSDAYILALLLNATGEPHFHVTAGELEARLKAGAPARWVVAEEGGQVVGLGTLSLPDFHPTHAWVGLSLHPDHLTGGATPALLGALEELAHRAGRPRLWASVRQDYQPAHPDFGALGFREVHRTFGGGLFLDGPLPARASALPAGSHLSAAAPLKGDPRLDELYALTRGDKICAPPTIPPAGDTLADDDSLWEAGYLAWQGEQLVGLGLPERSGLGAWQGVLIVHPEHRRRGLGTALLTSAARSLREMGLPFLNTAGVATDQAYLGTLRRAGAAIEPLWIAWERGPAEASA